MEPVDRPDTTGRDALGRGRMSSAASQAARDHSRLQASQQAVTSEVIAFQVLQQRAKLASSAELDPGRVAASLSAREREVIALVAAGRSDGEIASELFISKKTASVHVANIKVKLDASSRVEIAMLAARLGLVAADTEGAGQVTATSRQAGLEVSCPFKGLANFDIADGAYFFGRERVVGELVARLAATTFLAVVGPSGSGKSSVVRAGLAPALQAGVLPGSIGWPLAIHRPGDRPGAALEHALEVAMRGTRTDDDGPAGDAWLDRLAAGVRLVLLVDQFEEIWTVCHDADERERFLNHLAALARDPGRRALVVVAIRSEFYGRCAEHRELAELASASTVLLGPMSADELTRAIELPARAAGLRLDANLAPTLVTDVLQQPGALPLLSSTLLELWQRREGRSMRIEAYRALGGVSGAVGRMAEDVFGPLAPADQAIARSILLRLAGVDEGGVVTRRRVPIGEIDSGRSPDAERVLAALVDGRLLTVDAGHVEPAHEALLREWPRMRGWLQDGADARRIREHLAGAAREWASAGRESSELYRGPRLQAAADWAAEHPDELNALERTFLEDSRAAADAELVRQRRINVRLRGLLGVVGVLLVLALGAGVVALRQADAARDASLVARVRELGASSRVAALSDTSLGRLLAVAAADNLPPDVETEAVLHEAWLDDAVRQRIPMPEGRQPGLVASIDPAGRRLAAVWGHETDGPTELEVSEVADGTSDWSYRTDVPGAWMDEAYFSLDGSRVVTSLLWAPPEDMAGAAPPPDELGILVFDAATGRLIDRIDTGPCGTALVGITAAGYVISPAPDDATPDCYAGDIGNALALVDPGTRRIRPLVGDNLGDAMVSRDGRVLAYSTLDENAVVADVATGQQRVHVLANTWPQLSGLFRAISSDGSLALYGDRPPLVLDTKTGQVIHALRAGEGENWDQAFALEGDLAYTSGRDAALRVWNARTGIELFAVPGVSTGPVLPTADGRALVADYAAGTVTVTDPRPRGEVAEVRTCQGFAPAGYLRVVGSLTVAEVGCDPGTGTYYGIDRTAARILWTRGDTDGQHTAVSPDATRIVRQTKATWGVEIDDAATGRTLVHLEGLCAWGDVPNAELRAASPGCKPFPTTPFPFWIQDIQFSPDGSLVVGLDELGYLVAWDAVTGHIVGTLPSSGTAWGLVFSPDGREIILGTEGPPMMRAYSTTTWQPTRQVAVDPGVPGGRITPIAFLDGGRMLLAAGGLGDRTGGWLHRLDAATLTVVDSHRVHAANLKAATLSPDGTQVATAAADGVVRVWDTATLSHLLHELRVPGQAQGVAFVDEQHLAVTPQRGDVLIMSLDRDELLRIVRGGLTRGFTSEECAQYGFGDACPTLGEMRAGPASTH